MRRPSPIGSRITLAACLSVLACESNEPSSTESSSTVVTSGRNPSSDKDAGSGGEPATASAPALTDEELDRLLDALEAELRKASQNR